MGRHSVECKRRKRKSQKKRKREKRRQSPSDVRDSSDCCSSSNGLSSDQSSAPDQLRTDNGEESEEDLCTILDRVAARSERFWDDVDPEIQELQKYKDAHPSVVVDEDRHIEVFIGGDTQDYRGMLRVSTEEYFARVNNRERKAMSLCRTLRNRIESLEKEIEASKQKVVSVHKEKKRAVGAMREFWRNKILEEQSYGGRMMLAAIRRGYL